MQVGERVEPHLAGWRIDALVSRRPGEATCRLDEVQLKMLGAALDEGPVATASTSSHCCSLGNHGSFVNRGTRPRWVFA